MHSEKESIFHVYANGSKNREKWMGKSDNRAIYLRGYTLDAYSTAAERRMIMSIEYPCVYWSDGMCKKFSDDKSTSWCVEGPCGGQMPSNADKIRAMSDEELKEFICSNSQCKFCKFERWGRCELLEWLQQSVKENDYD